MYNDHEFLKFCFGCGSPLLVKPLHTPYFSTRTGEPVVWETFVCPNHRWWSWMFGAYHTKEDRT